MIIGYRLSHTDGSKSRWQFINDNDSILTISIKLKNGSKYHFSEGVDFLSNWARLRDLTVARCCFAFNPDKMTFVRMTENA